MKAHIKIITTIVLIGLTSSLLTGCMLFPKEESIPTLALIEPAKIDYKTVEVTKGNISKELKAKGSIVPNNRYNVYFEKRGGYLSELLVKPGDKVEKGQVLAILDTEDLEYEILEQELKLKKVQAVLKDSIQEQAKKVDIEKISIDVKIEEVALQKLKNSLSKAKLISPVAGMVNYRTSCNIGGLVGTYELIYTIVNTTEYILEYENTDVSHYKTGMNARIIYNGASYDAKVVTVQSELSKDDKTHYHPFVLVEFLKRPDKIALGEYTEFRIELEKKENVLLVSKKAINTSGDYAYVQVLENEQVQERFIEIGIENETEVEVVKGLKEGDQVIEK